MTDLASAYRLAGRVYELARSHSSTEAEAMEEAVRSLRSQGNLPAPVSLGLPAFVVSLIEAVASGHGITSARLRKSGRSLVVASIRAEAVYAARALGRVSYPELGRYFGRHHTSLIHGQRKFEARLASDELLARRMADLVARHGRVVAAGEGVAVA